MFHTFYISICGGGKMLLNYIVDTVQQKFAGNIKDNTGDITDKTQGKILSQWGSITPQTSKHWNLITEQGGS